jgi:hypothetical protein
MSLFAKQTDFLGTISVALGTTYQLEIPRDFHLERITLKLSFTVSTAAATQSADGLMGIVRNVTLNINDALGSRSVFNAGSASLLEEAMQHDGGLDTFTTAHFADNTTGVKNINIPLACAPGNYSEPLRSAFLIPLGTLQANPQLVITMASQADMDVNATPTFAITGATLQVMIEKREVVSTDPNIRLAWPTNQFDVVENNLPVPADLSNYRWELPNGCHYLGILMGHYSSTSARANIETANGDTRLQVLSQVKRRFTFSQLAIVNGRSIFPQSATQFFAGSYYLDFASDSTGADVRELGDALDAYVLINAGAKFELILNLTGGTGRRIKFLYRRAFGDISRLKVRPERLSGQTLAAAV